MAYTDPVTGITIAEPGDITLLDNIPLSQNPVPVADIGGTSPVRRPLAYPDDIIPVTAVLAYGQKDQEPKAGTYTIDAPSSQPHPVASLNVHVTGSDATSTGSSGSSITPVGYYIGVDAHDVVSIGPATASRGDYERFYPLCYGLQAAWWIDPDNSTFPCRGYIVAGLDGGAGSSNGVLITFPVYINSLASGDVKSGRDCVMFNPPIDLAKSNFLDSGGGTTIYMGNQLDHGYVFTYVEAFLGPVA